MTNAIETSPLSHVIDVRRIKQGGETIKIQPKKAILAGLAKAQELLDVKHFEAKLVLRPWRKGGARLSGVFNAEVIHPCSITLTPVPQSIKAEFEANFAPISDLERKPPKRDVEDGAMLLDVEDNEPDYFEGATIDIGATLEEFFALELDPYPRAEGAELPETVVLSEREIEDEKPSPFAGLANWQNKS